MAYRFSLISDSDYLSLSSVSPPSFPSVQFRKIGVNLGKEGFMAPIVEGTRDILPTLIFNNAGFVATGLFSDSTIDGLMANYTCNATVGLE